MLIRGDDHASSRARVEVDVWVHAPLTDQSELVETLEQRRPDLGSLADENYDLGISQALGKRVSLLNMIVPDIDPVPVQFTEAGERA